MTKKIFIIAFLYFLSLSSYSMEGKIIKGTYPLQSMFEIKNLTFPRVLVYDSNGNLIEKSKWPEELKEIENNSGEAYCCISDNQASSGEPPEDCKRIIYGENIDSHFNGLVSLSTGEPIYQKNMPKSEYLIVEYYAEWCAPCLGARKSLERFFNSELSNKYTALIIDFTKMQEKM